MTAAQSVQRAYDARIKRAHQLAARHSFAQQILTLYESVASFQKNLSTHFASLRKNQPRSLSVLSLREAIDLTEVLPHMRALLRMIEQTGPANLSEAARQLAHSNPESWIPLLNAYWQNGGRANQRIDAFKQFFPRVILQPYAETLACEFEAPDFGATPELCPLCHSQPLLGVLRVEGDSGKRFLLCSFCSQEWPFRRLLCANCGEESEPKLPVYVAEQFPHIRMEACETCSTFLRTIDLTKDGHAIPMADDLAAIPLSLWAQEHNFSALQPNLLGT